MDDEEDIPSFDDTGETDSQDLGPGLAYEEGPPVSAVSTMPQPLILSGPQGPVSAPMVAPPPAAMQSPEVAASHEMIRRLQYRYNGAPVEEAEKGVALALRFQGIRQYQNDVARGVNPAEALAKSAVLMFGGGKQSSLGQAGTFVKNVRPEPPQVFHWQGNFWRRNPDGTVTQIATGPARRVGLTDVQKAMLGADVAQLKGIEKQIAGTEEHGFGILHPLGGNKSEMDALRQKAADVRKKIQTEYGVQAPSTAAATVPVAAPSVARIRVRGPNGRFGTIPASQLDAALKNGYSRAQ